jgi:putative N-acetyltransferase (TIGR04045 family)
MPADAMIFPFASLDRFVPTQFRIRVATEAWELAGCRALRRSVFCDEQRIFAGDDRDAIDEVAITLAAVSWVAVSADQVVGTVRIHEAAPGIWFGSRLAVDRSCRRVGGIGTELIRLAVGTAHARGATEFYAHVQQANVRLFQSLHWRSLESVSVHGHPHDLMQADLAHYPPHHAGDISLLRSKAAA